MRAFFRVAAGALLALALIITHLAIAPTASADPEPEHADPDEYGFTLLVGFQADDVVDVVMHLYEGRSPTDTPLASDDNSGWRPANAAANTATNARLVWSLTAGTWYTVEVTTKTASVDGRFTLHVGLKDVELTTGVITDPKYDVCHEHIGLQVRTSSAWGT